MGCGYGLFCWENTTSGMNWCQKRKAAGQPAVWSTWGYAYTCQSGFFRNTTGTPTCVSYDGMWGMVGQGGQCYYQDLGSNAHALCMDGLYCDSDSTCHVDQAFPSSCDLNANDCAPGGLHRPSNRGECACNSTSGVLPVCVNVRCGQQGVLWAQQNMAWMRCGTTPTMGDGQCQGTYNQNWNGSCAFRAQVCSPPKSYQECYNNFLLTQYKKVLFPSGSICGVTQNPNVAIYWPSYCSSASMTQPLLVLVAVLMALLQL
jgi:hypothetical protein